MATGRVALGRQTPDTVTGTTPDWYAAAACRGLDPEMFYPPRGTTAKDTKPVRAAKNICYGCTVRTACLDAALAEETTEEQRHGIRGDLTSRERRAHRVKPAQDGAAA